MKNNLTLSETELARDLGCSVHPASAIEPGFGVTAAIELLRNTEWKVGAMAREAGWKSRKDLYRALRRFADLSPTAIRALPQRQARARLTRLNDVGQCPPPPSPDTAFLLHPPSGYEHRGHLTIVRRLPATLSALPSAMARQTNFT